MDPRLGKSFAACYEEHVWTVYGFFGYRVRSRQKAEDLTQTTFERALRAWDRYDPERASQKTWLLVIARNLLIDESRRNEPAEPARHDPEDQMRGVASDAMDPAAEALDLGLAADLREAIDLLGERERELIALRFGGDMTGPEIAEITGLTLANVQQILSRALRRMRAELSDHPPVRRLG